MRRRRPAEIDKRHLVASIGLSVIIGASALVGLAAFEAAKGASAVVPPTPFPEELAVATEDVSPEEDAAPPVAWDESTSWTTTTTVGPISP